MSKGQVLFAQGEPGDCMFVVVEGIVAISSISPEGDEYILHTLEPGASFGELSLLDGGPRSAFATALAPGTLLVLGRDDFRDAIYANPALTEGLFVLIGTALRRQNVRASDHVFLDLPGRVAKYVLDQPSTDGTVRLAVNQATIARMLGGTRQGVNQALSTFQRLGWLRLQGQLITLLDVDRLRDRAGL
jgi:CRP/FNR family cyclic AMP-dependent transcriptional regulator